MENDAGDKLEKILEVLETIVKKLDSIEVDIAMVGHKIDRMD